MEKQTYGGFALGRIFTALVVVFFIAALAYYGKLDDAIILCGQALQAGINLVKQMF
jgi:hypothetical protein